MLFSRTFRRLLMMQAAFSFSWSLFFLLPKFLTTELQASGSDIGLVSAIPPATGALLIPLLGRTIDRIGRRPAIVAGTMLVAVYACGMLLVDQVGPLLLVLQVLQGAAFTLAFNGAGTLAADLAPPERLGQAMGIFGSANVVMNAVAPSTAELLEAQFGWWAAFSASATAAVLATGLALGLPGSRSDQADHHDAPQVPVRLQALLVDMAIMAAGGAAFATVITFYQPFAIQLGMTEMRGFFIGFTTTVLIMRLGFGQAFDRVGRRPTAVVSSALYVLAVLAMTQLGPGLLPWIGAAIGIAHGAFYPTMQALALEGARPGERGRVTVFFNGGFQLGFAGSVPLLGPVADRYGYPSTFVVGAGLAACALLLVIARPRLRREPAPTSR